MPERIMDSVVTPPPKFVKNMWAWAYTVQKLYDKTGRTPDDPGFNYGAAINIYKRVLAKHGRAVNADPLSNLLEMTTHTRATLIQLKADVWTVGHNAAWSATDEAHQRLYFQEHFHLANAGDGRVVVDPIFVWRIERHEGSRVVDLAIADGMASWLVEGSANAERFVRERQMQATGPLNAALTEVDLVQHTRDVRGLTIAHDQLDALRTKDLMREALARLSLEVVA